MNLADARYVSLTTFKKDGTEASTPVWIVGDDGRLLVWTGANTWKAKRIRRDPHVRVTPCTMSGKLRGEPVDAEASILEDTELVRRLLARKYPLGWPATRALNLATRLVTRKPPGPTVTLEIRPR